MIWNWNLVRCLLPLVFQLSRMKTGIHFLTSLSNPTSEKKLIRSYNPQRYANDN